MRNSNVIMSVVLMGGICFTSIHVWASGIENKVSWSAEFVRTVGNRNAATDSADIAAYNPAGLVKLEDGAYINAATQVMLTDSENVVSGLSYESDTTSLVPGIFGVYKKDKWAGFLTLTIPGGGGIVDFEDGNGTTNQIGRQLMLRANGQLAAASVPSTYFYDGISSQSLEASNYAVGATIGTTYQVNDMMALSIGLRYVDAEKNAEGTITIDARNPLAGVNGDITGKIKYEQTAQGYTGVFGVCFFPTADLTIGARYETITKLQFDTDVKNDNLGILAASGIAEDVETDRDLPAYLALGVSYRIAPALRMEASFNYYFNENADWDGAEANADNGYDAGIMLEYAVSPKIKVSTGYLYTKTEIDPEAISREALQLDGNSFGGGIQYQLRKNLTVNAGVYHTFYKKASRAIDLGGLGGVSYEEEYDKAMTNVAMGVQYKF